MKARLSLLSVVLAALLFVVVLPASAAPNPPLDFELALEDMVLHERDLCNGVILESHILNPLDDSNPLKKPVEAVERQEYESLSSVKQYTEAYMSSGVSHDGQVALASFAYMYDTHEIAQNVLELLSSDILKGEENASLYGAEQGMNATTQTILLDEENISTVWSISVRNKIIILTVSVGDSSVLSTELLSADNECLSTKGNNMMDSVTAARNTIKDGGTTASPRATAGYVYAWGVTWVFNDPWYNPHFAARFSGSNGSGQLFACPVSTPPSSIGSWDWWGNNNNSLLIEKRWLFLPDTYYENKWLGLCYWANLN